MQSTLCHHTPAFASAFQAPYAHIAHYRIMQASTSFSRSSVLRVRACAGVQKSFACMQQQIPCAPTFRYPFMHLLQAPARLALSPIHPCATTPVNVSRHGRRTTLNKHAEASPREGRGPLEPLLDGISDPILRVAIKVCLGLVALVLHDLVSCTHTEEGCPVHHATARMRACYADVHLRWGRVWLHLFLCRCLGDVLPFVNASAL